MLCISLHAVCQLQTNVTTTCLGRCGVNVMPCRSSQKPGQVNQGQETVAAPHRHHKQRHLCGGSRVILVRSLLFASSQPCLSSLQQSHNRPNNLISSPTSIHCSNQHRSVPWRCTKPRHTDCFTTVCWKPCQRNLGPRSAVAEEKSWKRCLLIILAENRRQDTPAGSCWDLCQVLHLLQTRLTRTLAPSCLQIRTEYPYGAHMLLRSILPVTHDRSLDRQDARPKCQRQGGCPLRPRHPCLQSQQHKACTHVVHRPDWGSA